MYKNAYTEYVGRPGVVYAESVLAALALVLFFSVIAKEPGPIPDRDRRAKAPVPPGVPWCPACRVRTGRRENRCPQCKVSVVARDQHFSYLGVCIGASNFHLYLAMLWLSSFFQLLAFIAVIYSMFADGWNRLGLLLAALGPFPTVYTFFLGVKNTVWSWRSPIASCWARCTRSFSWPPGRERCLHIRFIEEDYSHARAAAMEEGNLQEAEAEELGQVVFQRPEDASIHIIHICFIKEEEADARVAAMEEGDLGEPQYND